jgi:hypothetical protein
VKDLADCSKVGGGENKGKLSTFREDGPGNDSFGFATVCNAALKAGACSPKHITVSPQVPKKDTI